jgi:hypothetical protein
MKRCAHLDRAEDAPALVHVRSHSRPPQNVLTVMTFARVSTALPLPNGHTVGRVTAPSNSDSDKSLSPSSRTRDTPANTRGLTGQKDHRQHSAGPPATTAIAATAG